MYGYYEYIDLTWNQVMTKVSQEQVFELILNQPFDYSLRYTSPIRKDDNPDCRFERRLDGVILFLDFGDKEQTHHTCLGLAMKYYNTNMEGVIKVLVDAFQLPTDPTAYISSIPYEREETTHHKTREEVHQSETIITYKKKEYDKRDILYWSNFLIKPQHLFEDNVFSASYIHISNRAKKKVSYFRPQGLCYVIDFLDAVKVYQPYNSKYKWFTNCNENHIGNVDNLPESGDKLVICKAYKDHRIFRNLELDAHNSYIWFHSEGIFPSTDILVNLLSRFKKLVVFYDNDIKGIEASRKLAWFLNELKVGSTTERRLPTNCGYKDLGELVHREGRGDTIKLLNTINI